MSRAKRSALAAASFAALLFVASGAHAQSYPCNPANLGTNCTAVIPDGSLFRNTLRSGSLTSQLVVQPGQCDPSARIVDVNVMVKIAHESVGDLSVTLTHPDGTTSSMVLFRAGLSEAAKFGCP